MQQLDAAPNDQATRPAHLGRLVIAGLARHQDRMVVGHDLVANISRRSFQAAIQVGVETLREQGPTPWRYSKAGLVTTDLVPLDEASRPLFDSHDREKSGALMSAMDVCNSRSGRGAVVPARAGLVEKRTWSTKFEMRSPRFTTRLSEVPCVSAVL